MIDKIRESICPSKYSLGLLLVWIVTVINLLYNLSIEYHDMLLYNIESVLISFVLYMAFLYFEKRGDFF